MLVASQPPWPKNAELASADLADEARSLGLRMTLVWHPDLRPHDVALVVDGSTDRRGASFDRFTGDLVLVCTHAKHDLCCGRFGPRLVEGLRSCGIDALSCSHIGGDRFAPNLLLLPEGIMLGRLDRYSAAEISASLRDRRLLPGTLRGRRGDAPFLSVVEEAVRGHADAWSLSEHFQCTPDVARPYEFDVGLGGVRLRVRLFVAGSYEGRFTCSAAADSSRELLGVEILST